MSSPTCKCRTVVVGITVHCNDCAATITKCALKVEGVRTAEADIESNTLTVRGEVDATKVKEFLHKNTHKEVKLIRWTPIEEPWEVIHVECLCSDCLVQLKRIAHQTKGLEKWRYNEQMLTVKVRGRMDVKALRQTLKHALKKHGNGEKAVLVSRLGRQPIVVNGPTIFAEHLHLHVGLENLQLVPNKPKISAPRGALARV